MSKSKRNKTISLSLKERKIFGKNLITLTEPCLLNEIKNKIIHQDIFDVIPLLPSKFIDLLFIDPPYNLTKDYNSTKFKAKNESAYVAWLESWLSELIPCLKDEASIYICADWTSSNAIYQVGRKYFTVQNRITWEREKGRGAKRNWKNSQEDIWFFTKHKKDYTFNVDDVKMRKEIIAPYSNDDGTAKDWTIDLEGKYRLTYPSNFWKDITVPFWSMSENTEHSTQKSEKMIAKIMLASSNKGDIIFDPFIGSGTTSVVAKKLERNFVGVEIDLDYCLLGEKRLAMADKEFDIQGYIYGYFLMRNA